MSTINQLSAVDSLQGGDNLPLYSNAQGDTRRASMTTLAEYIDSVSGSANSLRADLASTATGKGAALVAYVGSVLTLAQAIARINDTTNSVGQIQIIGRGTYLKSTGTPTSDEATYGWAFTDAGGTVWRKPLSTSIRAIEWGVTAHTSHDGSGNPIGTPADQAPILNALCAYMASSTTAMDGGVISFDGLYGAIYLASSVKVPFGIGFDGVSAKMGTAIATDINGSLRFRPRADGVFRTNTGTTVSVAGNTHCRDGILFWLNVDWTAPTTWIRAFPGLCGSINDVFIDGTTTGGIKGFRAAGSYKFKRIRYHYVSTLIEKPSVYADAMVIEDVDGFTRADDASYNLISLIGLGDGVRIDTVSTGYTPGGAICGGVSISFCAGGHVSGLINGIHTFTGSRAVSINNAHIEDGQFVVDGASVTINAAWLNNGSGGMVPIVVKNTVGASALTHHRVTINDCQFMHFVNPLGAGGIAGWASTPILDIDVQSPRMAVVMNGGNRRVWSVNGNVDQSHHMAPVIGDSTDSGGVYTDANRRFANWLNYGHMLASREYTIMHERVEVTGTMPDRGFAWNGISLFNQTVASGVTFKGATGTNTYLVRQLSDPVRLIGRAASSAASLAIAVTNGSTTLPGFRLADSSQGNRGWVMFEVYRDTGTTGNYDKRVLIAGANLDRFVDDGNALNSFAWEAYGPGAITTINNAGLGVRASYLDNVVTVRNSLVGASGLVGTWTQGDQILRENFTPDAFGIKRIGSFCRTGGTSGTWDEINVGTGGSASKTWDPPSVAAQSAGVPGSTSTTVTATGVVLGDTVVASFSLALSGLRLVAEVTAADTVTCTLYNHTAGAIDLGSGTLRVRKLL